jgi:hypothetical protein
MTTIIRPLTTVLLVCIAVGVGQRASHYTMADSIVHIVRGLEDALNGEDDDRH